ncbi:MAG: 50S ribosomal protein L10 [Elusimicrobia bacterium]|nr:50S ribosomal protein L10 [Candidatus Obscuribacterium magneticum]
MPSAMKEQFVQDLAEELKSSEHVVVTEFQGLTTDELNGLRAQLLGLGTKYKIVKNRLAKIVFKKRGWADLEGSLRGPTALAYGGRDSAMLAKILYKFSGDHKNLKVKAGHLFGNTVDENSLKIISSLPSKEVLIAILLSRLNSPLQSLVAVLDESLRALQASLVALARKKETAPIP